jgi:hypothetical protein
LPVPNVSTENEDPMKITDDLLKFRAEFHDVKSLADLPHLSPDRLARFKQQLAQLEDPGDAEVERRR